MTDPTSGSEQPGDENSAGTGLPSRGAPTSVGALAAEYGDLARRWAQALYRPDEAKRIEREQRDLYYRLRTTEAGRAAISSLLDDPETPVRVWAATHSLEWDPGKAELVLRAVADTHKLFAVNAAWALRSYRAGQLLSVLGVRDWNGRWLQPQVSSGDG